MRPDLTTEEHRRRGDEADALWSELVRRATGGAHGMSRRAPLAAALAVLGDQKVPNGR